MFHQIAWERTWPCGANSAHVACQWCCPYRTRALPCSFPEQCFEISCWPPYRHLRLLTSLSVSKDTGVKAWSCTYRGSWACPKRGQLRLSSGLFLLGICACWSSRSPLMKDWIVLLTIKISLRGIFLFKQRIFVYLSVSALLQVDSGKTFATFDLPRSYDVSFLSAPSFTQEEKNLKNLKAFKC